MEKNYIVVSDKGVEHVIKSPATLTGEALCAYLIGAATFLGFVPVRFVSEGSTNCNFINTKTQVRVEPD